MKKNILSLIMIFSISSLEVNAELIEVKKQKAFILDDKTSLNINNIVLPQIIEDSVVIKEASKDFIKLKSLKVSGEYAYSLMKLNLLPNSKNKNALSLYGPQEVGIQEPNLNSSYLLKDDLRIVLDGPYKKILISNGSFIIRFKKNTNKNKFLQDYNIEKSIEFPDFTSYKAKTFNGINDLLDNISKDKRVDTIELDLIDPSIRPN
jgi:hypothetical protein